MKASPVSVIGYCKLTTAKCSGWKTFHFFNDITICIYSIKDRGKHFTTLHGNILLHGNSKIVNDFFLSVMHGLLHVYHFHT